MKLYYETHGWVHLSSVFDEDTSLKVKELGLPLRENWQQYSNWKGIQCASRFSPELFKYYTSKDLYEISHELLGDVVHLFNDQIVIKMPYDDVIFAPHFDNQYAPNQNQGIHTVNICWILDDFTDDNGAIEVRSQHTGEWDRLYPKRGDLLAINGNTLHRSSQNRTDDPRGLYACVYSDKPIHIEGHYTELFEKPY